MGKHTAEPEWRHVLARAKHLIHLERPAEAARHAARAASMAPGEAAPLCVLAVATADMGENEAALEQIERAVSLAPDWDWPHRVRGSILLDLKKYDLALDAAQTAVRLAPELPEAWILSADAHRLAGDLEQADRAAARLLEAAPERSSTYEILTQVAYQRKQWLQAEKWAREGLKIDADSTHLKVLLGRILSDMSRFDQAVDLVHSAVRHDPRDDWNRASLDKVSSEHSQARFNTLALAVCFFPLSLFLASEAVRRWQEQEAGPAVVLGISAVLTFAIALFAIRMFPRRLPAPLRRYQLERIKKILREKIGNMMGGKDESDNH
jgi:tetratricopeptide (TPR) repeat protein